MKCILHIGATKTGTTAIQNALWNTRVFLAANGVFLISEERGAFHSFADALRDEENARHSIALLQNGLTTPEKRRAFQKTVLRSLDGVMRGKKYPYGLISSEVFSEYRDKEIRKLAKILGQYFDAFQVVLYIREQTEWIRSYYSQALRNYCTDTIDRFALQQLGGASAISWHDAVMSWGRVFGMENISVIVYEDEKNRLIQSFFSILHMDVPAGTPDRAVNESLSPVGQSLLRSLNELLCHKRIAFDSFQEMRERINKTFAGKGAHVSPHVRDAVREFFAPGNAALCERFFPGRTLLFPQRDEDAGERNGCMPTPEQKQCMDAIMKQIDCSSVSEGATQ